MPSRSEFAVRFAVASTLLLAVAGGVAAELIRLFPVAIAVRSLRFPPMFLVSSSLLLIGSVSMSRAIAYVRRERQARFRQHLVLSLLAGTLFVATQTYALNCLIRQLPPGETPFGAGSFVAVIAALHAMHFLIALLFLVFVTIQAFEDRYDHEYYWGVTICAWFWHVLGMAWLVVLAVMLIASLAPESSLTESLVKLPPAIKSRSGAAWAPRFFGC